MPGLALLVLILLGACQLNPDYDYAGAGNLGINASLSTAAVTGEEDAELLLWVLPAEDAETALDRAPVGQVPQLDLDRYSDLLDSNDAILHREELGSFDSGSIELELSAGEYHVQLVIRSTSDDGANPYVAATYLDEDSPEYSLAQGDFQAPVKVGPGERKTADLRLVEGEELWIEPGSLKWTFATGGLIFSSPAFGEDETLYFGSTDDNLYAVDSSGNELWSFPTGGQVRSSPAVGEDGTIYVGSNDNAIYAIDPNGNELWSFPTAGQVRLSPAIAEDGTLYFGDDNGETVYAVDSDGNLSWEFTGAVDRVRTSPAIADDGTVYIGSNDNNVYALDPDNGNELWMFPTADAVLSDPAIGADGTVYIGSNDANLYALDGASGGELWSFAMEGEIQQSSAVVDSDGTVYSGEGAGGDNYVYAIDGETGAQLWRTPIDGGVRGVTIAADGILYVGAAAADGYVYAIDAASGSVRWSEEIAGEAVDTSPIVGEDGTVYVGARDNNLYAFRTHSPGIAEDAPWPIFGHNASRTGRRQ